MRFKRRPIDSLHRATYSHRFRAGLGLGLPLAVVLACTGKIESTEPTPGTGGSPSTGGTGGTGGTVDTGGTGNVGGGGLSSTGGSTGGSNASGSGGTVAIHLGGTSGASGEAGAAPACATESATAMLTPVYLAFAFDVSGSMGALDFAWHDPALKWDPIVAATRGFFEAEASTGLHASLTVFPSDREISDHCREDSYVAPEVAMRDLPSTTFGEKLDIIRAGEWRGDTPTLAVVQGVFAYMEEYKKDHDGNYALVLVTDGLPAGCDDSTIQSVEDAVQAKADSIPTYVIGVKNPPITDAPDTVTNLQAVAEAGGTDQAFIIDTGDPEQTSADFEAAIDLIRGVSVSCSIDIPKPPNDHEFEKNKVAVSYTSGSTETELTYDADCASDAAWHYDDASEPTQVVLCDETCSKVELDPKAKLTVSFTCEPVIDDPR